MGEAPGFNEDRQGEPFVGAAGKLLDTLLARISLSRADVFITNVLKCRPPMNRDPMPNEAEACSPYLQQQLELVKPKAVLILGRHALERLMPGQGSISRIHGSLRQPQEIPRPGAGAATTSRACPGSEAGTRAAVVVVTSRLRYLPLGGLGEVGINMWALEWEGKILVVDAGLMFPQEDMLGIDLVLPDISYLLGRGREVRIGDSVQLGPFRLETVAVCHSIPDAVALAIQTPVGRVVYTSDFKIDAAPPDGSPTDMDRFRQLGDEGVLLLLSDSTNSEREGHSGSERDLHAAFEQIFGAAPGRIVVANFASNIHRIQHLVRMAAQFGRRVAVVGRSLQQNFKTARELGFLDVPEGITVPLAEIDKVPPSKLLLLTAGSQGEPLSALARFAAQRHPFVNVHKDDWVVISARPIPGNERMVLQTVNNLYRHGARVFYSEVGKVHVTGHAQRDELREMLDAVRPRFFIPVHGEYRQLQLHSDIAREAGLDDDRIAVVEDGESVELDETSMERGEKVPTGLVYVDGLGVGDVEQVVLRDRRHLAEDGILVVTLTLDRDTQTVRAGPDLVSRGVIEPELSTRLMADARNAAIASIRRFADTHADVNLLQEAIHDAVSKTVYKQTRRRPMVIPVITEI
ncbi:MAG: RNase J family beta-CASP ribonuclease [Chloroflexi bacterium]|nr:MAG: RNase J family beta-CASP ribonuclease [Chloroflexota bacterium]